MSRKTLVSSEYGDKIYGLFPKVYRDYDKDTNYALKRYIKALSDGGFAPVIDKTNELLTLFNSDEVKFEYMPYIFKMFGFDIFNGLPEEYVRRFLPIIGILYKYKGTLDVIDFLTTLLSGVQSEIRVETEYTGGILGENKLGEFHLGGDTTYHYTAFIDIFMPDEVGEKYFPDQEQLSRIVRCFIPFYLETYFVYNFFYTDSVAFHNLDAIKDYWTITQYSTTWLDIVEEEEMDVNIGVVEEIASIFSQWNECILGDSLLGHSILGKPRSADEVWDSIIEDKNSLVEIEGVDYRADSIFTLCLMGSAILGENRLDKYQTSYVED